MINRVKGTQDFVDLSLFNFTLDAIRTHLTTYNFSEISTPILEPTQLYMHVGTDTDVVKKEMYTYGENKDICLRPEGTSSMVRAFAENNIEQIPWRVFELAPCFRCERPQKGRWREFRQVSVEIIGASSVSHDAWLIKLLDNLFSSVFKLENYTVHINFLGIPEDRLRHKQALKEFLEKNSSGLCKTCLERKEKNILRIFDCKEESCQKIYIKAPQITGYLCDESKKEWELLQKQLELLSVSFVQTPTLVRGLDYYNKTVFEFSSPDLGSQSAFCGGGRYDFLVGQISGAADQPSVGAGIGFDRLLLLLEQKQDKLAVPQKPALTLVIPLEQEQNTLALLLADTLAYKNICTDILLDNASIKSKLRKANKLGAKWAVILGPDEQANRTAVLKNMLTGTQETIPQTELVNKIEK